MSGESATRCLQGGGDVSSGKEIFLLNQQHFYKNILYNYSDITLD
jgi:hypothetical protein